MSGYASVANARAIDVLPVPGGPYRITGGNPTQPFFTARSNICLMRVWPFISDRHLGLYFSVHTVAILDRLRRQLL